jgi:hypothetical protein
MAPRPAASDPVVQAVSGASKAFMLAMTGINLTWVKKADILSSRMCI